MILALFLIVLAYVLLALVSDAVRARRDTPASTLAESATRLARRRR